MSIDNPIFGVDLSHWNAGFSLRRAKREGIKFVFAKATEGPYRDGSRYTDPEYRRFMRRARLLRLPRGAYHFLVATDPLMQVNHFLKVVGNPKGKMLMVDFESYPNFPSLTPSNFHLERFVDILKRKTGQHPVILYSGVGFWTGGDSSGNIGQYHTDKAWDAYYPRGDTPGPYRELYERVQNMGWGERWGGVVPLFWQYSSAGNVGGRNVDVNAFRGSLEELKALAAKP